MSKFSQMFSSRTFWTIVVIFLYNGVGGIHSLIPASFSPLVDGILSIVAIYFKLNPSQTYTSA